MLDDIARVAGGTVSVASGIGRQVKQDLRARIEEMALRLDLVPRDEFERLETLLGESLRRQEILEKRLAALECAAKQEKAKSTKKKKAEQAVTPQKNG